MKQALSENAIQEQLALLNRDTDQQWSLVDGKLHKTFVFDDFIGAFAWMTKIAIHAEKLDHHPEWFNVYNKVKVDLQTHDANGITELDFMLADKMEKGR
ncbi:MAG: 4a-hydroxytetrahydrobiopterin dehydratase [Pseudomonadota bacterium]